MVLSEMKVPMRSESRHAGQDFIHTPDPLDAVTVCESVFIEGGLECFVPSGWPKYSTVYHFDLDLLFVIHPV